LILSLLALAILGAASYFLFFSRPAQPPETAAQADFSSLSWTKAFDSMHDRLSREYAFTEWKGIDWQHLYDGYAPKIKEAESNSDFNAYYLALRAYLNEIPDGHVRVNNIGEIDNQYIGGGFGLSAAKLSDGSVIAAWVDESSPAYTAGMRAGARLSLQKSYPDAVLSDKIRSMFLNVDNPDPVPPSMVETKTLDGNISYVKIWGEIDADL